MTPTIESLDEIVTKIIEKAKVWSDVELATFLCGIDKEDDPPDEEYAREILREDR